MPRPAYPTQLRDHSGNEVRLSAKPFATGGEGAVFDVVGRPNLVAKLYSKPQNKERCDKLHAMAKLCTPELLKIAAWPTATLSNGNPAAVEGILMPRIADHKEIHHLYSVAQRKKDFPQADWGFLLHTARNRAIAFESVHGHGHIVGDVNQKNVMVSKKGIVALVDCDSFQVKEGNRIYRCGVGVPEYTPPELHGRKFTDLDRNASHDLFGLAVMVFHLLMMGRHPFAGVPQINIDIPIEKAIQDGLYAYARNPTKLKPPPHVPPLAMLDIRTRDLFERAFRSPQRPTATEWRDVLDASMKGLQRCKNDPKHSYPVAGSCPWCQLIAVARLMFFIPSQVTAGATLRIEDIRNLVQKLTGAQLMFASYTRPTPIFPVEVTLPAGLRATKKPELQPYPVSPAPLQKPSPVPAPPPPVLLASPTLRRPPTAPAIPPAPRLKPYPPAPVELPPPKLHATPPPPSNPPVPTPSPPDLFLERLCLAAAVAGGPLYFIALPVGMIMMFGFGVWWALMKLTEEMRFAMALKSLKNAHEAECAQMLEEYEELVRPIRKANDKILHAWKVANSAAEAKYAQLCRAIDDENRSRIAPWEAEKAVIEANHQRVTHELEQANKRVLSAWEAENDTRQASYDQARWKIELENQRRILAWTALSASRQSEHRHECDAIDARNQQLIAAWETTNAPWIGEQKRWRDRASAAEAEIKRMEEELLAHRQASVSKFKQRKANADGVIKSHGGALQDYERELRQAEMDSQKIQLEEHLDKYLIRHAKLKGITGERILSLESFGIATAKDVVILNNQKVPGIGPVLSKRLFDWRDKLASSFRAKQGLPESEKRRLATRYAPALLPLGQAIQAAINDLEAIAATHRTLEAKRVEAIAAVVQNRAVAEAYVRAMKVV
jgi:DNA-binding helix-hairpin-helix protein with protein kinase domain